MEKTQLIYQWLSEKYGGNAQQVLEEALTLLANHTDGLAEFQTWLSAKEAQLTAQKTPEALEAQKLATEQELARQLAAVAKAKK